MNVLDLKCLRNLVGVSRMDTVRKDEVRRRAGIFEKHLKKYIATVCQYNSIQVICLHVYKINFYF